MTKPPHRPIVRWFGGKWLQAAWILKRFPPHRCYVEPYGGAASIMALKQPAEVEVYNDRDDRLVCLFRVIRSEKLSTELTFALATTLFSRTEFRIACTPARREDFESEEAWMVETAHRLIVAGGMAYGTGMRSATRSGFRGYTGDARSAPVRDWISIPEIVKPYHERFRPVQIENRDALEVMRKHDDVGTLFYCDPPYVHATRSSAADTGYAHEMDDAAHRRLLDALLDLAGMVVLSGYAHPLYDNALHGWQRVERHFATQGRVKKTEVLWINPAASAALDASQPTLFEMA